jgi:hypothetical protein
MNLSCLDETRFNQQRVYPWNFADQAGLEKGVLVIIDPEFYHIGLAPSRLPTLSFTGIYHAQDAYHRPQPDP